MDELKTERQYGPPRVVQFSVFLDNRIGKLRELVDLFADTPVRVAAISVMDSADCAIVRCVCVPSQDARRMLKAAGMAASETELIVAELPTDQGLHHVLNTLVQAEVAIHYAYPLIVKPHRPSAMALHVDEPEAGASALRQAHFVLLGEDDLR